MKNQLPSLITSDARAGLALAGTLAGELRAQSDHATAKVEHPGGTNYLLPAPVPQEVITGILFYAIAAANQGWNQHGGGQ
jgi:hypothetical protein